MMLWFFPFGSSKGYENNIKYENFEYFIKKKKYIYKINKN